MTGHFPLKNFCDFWHTLFVDCISLDNKCLQFSLRLQTLQYIHQTFTNDSVVIEVKLNQKIWNKHQNSFHSFAFAQTYMIFDKQRLVKYFAENWEHQDFLGLADVKKAHVIIRLFHKLRLQRKLTFVEECLLLLKQR